MNNEQHYPISYDCPHCHAQKIETACRAPFIRGFLIAYQFGYKNFIGCTTCVRQLVLKEVGRSMLLGWFSISSLIGNPIFITFNLIKIPFIQINYAKARKFLKAAGISEGDSSGKLNISRLAYSLAASMMQVDGKIDEEEVKVAVAIGRKILPDFNENELVEFVLTKTLPSPQDIASILKKMLSGDEKKLICSYLFMIADADGHIDRSELNLLAEIASRIGLDPDFFSFKSKTGHTIEATT